MEKGNEKWEKKFTEEIMGESYFFLFIYVFNLLFIVIGCFLLVRYRVLSYEDEKDVVFMVFMEIMII